MPEPDRPSVIEVPTELERADAIIDWAILWLTLITAGHLFIYEQAPLGLVLVLALVVGFWALTGEALTDVQGLGAIATGLRSKTGQRRIHEWAFAYGHYFGLVVWPAWKERCAASWQFGRRRTTRWLRSVSARTRLNLWRVCSWVLAIRFNWSVRRAK